jgi:hypothetical protein
MSAKFDALAAKVGSNRLAGWITQHNPKGPRPRASDEAAPQKDVPQTEGEQVITNQGDAHDDSCAAGTARNGLRRTRNG